MREGVKVSGDYFDIRYDIFVVCIHFIHQHTTLLFPPKHVSCHDIPKLLGLRVAESRPNSLRTKNTTLSPIAALILFVTLYFLFSVIFYASYREEEERQIQQGLES
jgi:hypothetical protein